MRMLNRWLEKYKLILFNIKWRKNNIQNNTYANSIFPLDMVKVGKYTYGPINIKYYEQPAASLKIGNFCSISANTMFLLAGEHNYKEISTFPLELYILGEFVPDATNGPVIVDDDVWIGYGVTILSGVHIGQGAVIGAGSIVAKDVPPYAIYAGNKVIKYRFTEDVVKELEKINYNKISKEKYLHLKKDFREDISQWDTERIMLLIRKINE